MIFTRGLRRARRVLPNLRQGLIRWKSGRLKVEQYRFTVVLGEPTWLIRLTELAEQHGAPATEDVDQRRRRDARRRSSVDAKSVGRRDHSRWPAAAWKWGAGLAFKPCSNHDGYHIDDIHFLPEIIDASSDGYGEVVFTTLTRRVMPLEKLSHPRRGLLSDAVAGCSCGIPGAHRLEQSVARPLRRVGRCQRRQSLSAHVREDPARDVLSFDAIVKWCSRWPAFAQCLRFASRQPAPILDRLARRDFRTAARHSYLPGT